MRARCAEVASVLLAYGAFHAAVLGLLFGEPVYFSQGDSLFQNLPNWLAPPAPWNPFIFAGYPSQGDPQTMAGYPLALLLRCTPETWRLFVAASAFLASCNAYLLARSITRSRLAAAIGGLAYGANGFLLAHLEHVNLAHAAAWIPLLLFGVRRFARLGGTGSLVVVTLASGAAASAGYPQMLAYGLLMAGALWLVTSRPGGAARFAWQSLALLAATALGLGLAAGTLLPAWELAGQSIRTDLRYAEFLFGSLRIGNLPQLVFPWISGGRPPGWLVDWGRAYFAREEFVEVTGYPGLLTIALASLALERGRRDLLLRFLVGLTLLGLLFAMGKQVHAVGLFYLLPGLGQMRIPARHLVELELGLALLAAWGSARWLAAEPALRARLTRRAAATGLGAVAIALLIQTTVLATGHWKAYRERAGIETASAWPWLEPSVWLGIGGLGIGLLALRALGPRRPRLALGLVVIVLATDLGLVARGLHRPGDPSVETIQARPAALTSLDTELKRWHGRVFSLASNRFGKPPEALPPNLSQLWRLPSASGYGPLLLRHYAELTGAGPEGARSLAPLAADHRGLDLLSVELLLAPPAAVAEIERADPDGKRWKQWRDLGGAIAYRNARALPRAWCVSRIMELDDTAMLAAIRTSRLPDGRPFEPERTALIEAQPEPPHEVNAGCASVRIEPSPGQEHAEEPSLSILLEPLGPTWLVVSELDYPGWRAWIDGREAQIQRTNRALVGIAVPDGAARVDLRFDSSTRHWGERLSAVSGLAVFLMAVWPRERRSPGALRRLLD